MTHKPAIDNAFKNISVARTGLNDTNFNILTFSKMTDIARNIEKNFTVDLEYHYDKVVLGADGNPVIDEATGEAKTEDAVKKELGVSPASAASTVQNCIDNGKSYTYVTHSSLSSAAVAEYTRLFNIFASAAVERGYQGAQLEKEIKCASGNIYSTLTATKAVYAEDGKTVTTEASVAKKTGANAPRFGKWDAEGKLVNDGSYLQNHGPDMSELLQQQLLLHSMVTAIMLIRIQLTLFFLIRRATMLHLQISTLLIQNFRLQRLLLLLLKLQTAL